MDENGYLKNIENEKFKHWLIGSQGIWKFSWILMEVENSGKQNAFEILCCFVAFEL